MVNGRFGLYFIAYYIVSPVGKVLFISTAASETERKRPDGAFFYDETVNVLEL